MDLTKISDEENLTNFISIKMQVFEIIELNESPFCAAMEVIEGTVVSDILNDSKKDNVYLLVDHDTKKIWTYYSSQISLKKQVYGGILAGMLRQQLKLFYTVHSLNKLSSDDKKFQEIMNKPLGSGRAKSITEIKPQTSEEYLFLKLFKKEELINSLERELSDTHLKY